MTVTLPATAGDPLFRVADQVPLGSPIGLIQPVNATPSRSEVRPFGLRFATATAATVTVDMAGLRYDPRRQLSVDEAGVPVFGKHSTGQTNTRTSDGHKSMDSDTDHTED